LGGDATSSQGARTCFGDQFRRDIDQGGAVTGVTWSRTHLASMA
jgi:hypothetical protein